MSWSSAYLRQRAIGLQALGDRLGALWADIVAREVQARQRAADAEGVSDCFDALGCVGALAGEPVDPAEHVIREVERRQRAASSNCWRKGFGAFRINEVVAQTAGGEAGWVRTLCVVVAKLGKF